MPVKKAKPKPPPVEEKKELKVGDFVPISHQLQERLKDLHSASIGHRMTIKMLSAALGEAQEKMWTLIHAELPKETLEFEAIYRSDLGGIRLTKKIVDEESLF